MKRRSFLGFIAAAPVMGAAMAHEIRSEPPAPAKIEGNVCAAGAISIAYFDAAIRRQVESVFDKAFESSRMAGLI